MFHTCGAVQQRVTAPIFEPAVITYDCDICDSGDWLSETEVELHKRSMHRSILAKIPEQSSNVCLCCCLSFISDEELIEHIKYTHLLSSKNARRVEREMFICDECHVIFFNKSLLEVHIALRHLPKEKNIVLKCAACPKIKKSTNLYQHLSSLHQIKSVALCPICICKQQNRNSLREHVETHPKNLHCNICGYSISLRKRDFNAHLDMHESMPKKLGITSYKKYFLRPFKRRKFDTKLRSVLDGLKLYNDINICILCRQICTSHVAMEEHILRDHTYKPPVKTWHKKVCSCGEEFSTMILLKHHVFKNKGNHKLSHTVSDATTQEDLDSALLKDKPEQDVK